MTFASQICSRQQYRRKIKCNNLSNFRPHGNNTEPFPFKIGCYYIATKSNVATVIQILDEIVNFKIQSFVLIKSMYTRCISSLIWINSGQWTERYIVSNNPT